MAQDLNRHRTVSSSQTATLSWEAGQAQTGFAGAGNFSVESYADRLMDDLFADVEQSLDMEAFEANATPPVNLSTSDTARAQVQSEFDSPPPTTGEIESAVPLAIQLQASELPQSTATELDNSSALAMSPSEAPQPQRSYDRFLLAASCISLLLALGAWVLNQELRQFRIPPVAMQTQPTASSEPVISAGFSEYVQRSLDAIERRTQPNAVATVPANQSAKVAALPTVPVPATPTKGLVQPVPANQSNSVARVYVPNYPIPLSFLPNRAAFSPPPLVMTPSTAQPRVGGQQPVQAPAPLAVPSATRTLRGVVEIGKRSAALIETDGIVQSFRLGESIGSSGWTLVEVSKDRMIIRRNGEVRSISVEQRF